MFFADYHCHSGCSEDGASSMAEMARSASEIGLCELSVTDHCDIGNHLGDTFDEPAHISACIGAQGVSETKVLFALEMGEGHRRPEYAERVLKSPYDFIIGSIHSLYGHRDFYRMPKSDTEVCGKFLEEYINELEKLAAWGCFDVLGHVTYPLRYMNGRDGMNMGFEPFEERLRGVFQTIIAQNHGIEINVSGLWRGMGSTIPDIKWLKIYKECGGEIVTVGSDAHSAGQLAGVRGALLDGYEMLRQAGFRYITAFEGRKPRFESI